MLKTLFCLSAFLTLGTAAHAEFNSQQAFNEAVGEKIMFENAVARQDAQDAADDALNEVTDRLAGCPNCPRNPKKETGKTV